MCTHRLPVFVIFLWSLTTDVVSGQNNITIWDHINHEGDTEILSIDTCSNISEVLDKKVSSIDTHNKCARLYDQSNCEGRGIDFLPRSPAHGNLNDWKFSDQARSVGPCLNACDVKATGEAPNDTFTITVFNRIDFKGTYLELQITGCTLVPPQYVHHFSSVDTHGQCVQLWRNTKCFTNYSRHESDPESIELRNDTPINKPIGAAESAWWFREVRAVSHCRFRCNSNEESAVINEGPRESSMGEIVLYDNLNFSGNWKTVGIDKDCVNFESPWEGVAMSVTSNSNDCYILYDRSDCTGRGTPEIKSNCTNLEEYNFAEVARSVRQCNPRNVNIGSTDVALSPLLIIVISVTVLLIVGIIIGIGFVMIFLRKLQKSRKLSEREVRHFLKGFDEELGNVYMNFGNRMREGNVELADVPNNIEEVAVYRAYNMCYDVGRDSFSLDYTLGTGAFGIVYKGSFTRDRSTEPIEVAVKTLKSDSSVQNLRALMKEVKVMLYVSELGDHSNIIRVVGCCTEQLKDGNLFILIEYCSHGSLKSYLRLNREHFTSIVENGKINMEEAFQNKNYSMLYDQIQEGESSVLYFDYFQQLQWMIEIASGMEFLSSHKIVHRDLAARNILIGDNFQCKISDFGLSRKTYNYTNYLQKGEDPVPWRWLPVESLLYAKYSTKSDIWSYGVLCWEIFSLGAQPFAEESWGQNFISKLVTGLRLTKPENCVDECYDLLLSCWSNDPSHRPDFTEVSQKLRHFQDTQKVAMGENALTNLPNGYVITVM